MSPGSVPEFTVRDADWLDAASARSRVMDAAAALAAERVPVLAALGRALAEDITATATLPPWDNSAMDGYAVRAEDVRGASPARPVPLNVAGLTRAGAAPSVRIQPGEAVRIMTGAPVPPGADSVIRVEDTDAEALGDGVVRILQDRDAGRNIRLAGQDMKVGESVLLRGDSVRPGTIGTLAALGRADVVVHRRPSVAILSTGDELRTVERYADVRSGSGIPESNGPMIAAAALAAGAVPVPLGIARDEPEALRTALRRGMSADVLVTIGGASMGEADLVKRVLDGEGYVPDFWRVKIRPGTPFGFGRLPRDGTPLPVFGLPGNPASAFVTFEVFVRPFLLRMAGHRRVLRPRIRCVAGELLTGSGDLTVFLRVRLDGTHAPPRVVLTGPQGSGLVRGLADAEGLAILPEGVAGLEVGQMVDVILLDTEFQSGVEGPRSPW